MDDVYVHYMDGWMMYAFFHIIFLGRFLEFFVYVCYVYMYVCMLICMYVYMQIICKENV